MLIFTVFGCLMQSLYLLDATNQTFGLNQSKFARVSKIAQSVRVLAPKPEDLSLIPATHTVKESNFSNCYPLIFRHCMHALYVHTHT